MKDNLDIIPIHVFANSANQAEILNGKLRAQGLAVKPLWRTDAGDDSCLQPEFVFFFEDTNKPVFDDVLAYAKRHSAPLFVIARQYDSEAAQKALSAGAAGWLLVDHDVHLSAAVQSERRHRHNAARINQLQSERERSRSALQQNFSRSQDAIATISEGIVIEANAACADYFGYQKVKLLVGQPVMDLISPAGQERFKKALKTLFKEHSPQQLEALELVRADGSTRSSPLKLETLEYDGERCARVCITSNAGDKKLAARILELENANKAQGDQMVGARQNHSADSLLQPGEFSPLASQLLGTALTGAARALIIIRPEKWQEVHATFGSIGAAELGTHIGYALAELLEKDDLATRTADLNLLILATRADTRSLEKWLKHVVKTLGKQVFEGGEHSGQLGFVAGYAQVNRIRRLDVLINQAEEAAGGQSGTVIRHENNALEVDVDDKSWEPLIREALAEHRYTIVLQPVEDLTSHALAQVALPCLLDRDEQPINAEVFQPPAERLGLLQVLEHRFIGHAMRALLAGLKRAESSRMIVPLHQQSAIDPQLQDFLATLIKRAKTAPPPSSLILELDIEDVMNRVVEVQEFSQRVQKMGYAFGLRGYEHSAGAGKLVPLLPINSLRLSAKFTTQLEESEESAEAFKATVEAYKQKNIDLIATDVSNSSTMACLYNLGISLVQGPIIGEPELFRSESKA